MSLAKFNKYVNILAGCICVFSGIGGAFAYLGVDRIDNIRDITIFVSCILCTLLVVLVLLKFIIDKIHKTNIYVSDYSVDGCKKRCYRLPKEFNKKNTSQRIILHKAKKNGEMIFKRQASEPVIRPRNLGKNAEKDQTTVGVRFKEHGNQTLLICKIKFKSFRYLAITFLYIGLMLLSICGLLGMYIELFDTLGPGIEGFYISMLIAGGSAWYASFYYGGAFSTWGKFDPEIRIAFETLSCNRDIADNILKLPKRL